MDIARINSVKARTEQKLEYAIVHLDELKSHTFARYSVFEMAHQESYLFHLLGARDAFLAELNEYYECNLSQESISLGNLRKALKAKGRESAELKELYLLEKDEEGWFSHAKHMRDHSAHVHTVPRTYHRGGTTDGQVRLRHPKTNKEIEKDYIDVFEDWMKNMIDLLKKLRRTAEAKIFRG